MRAVKADNRIQVFVILAFLELTDITSHGDFLYNQYTSVITSSLTSKKNTFMRCLAIQKAGPEEHR